VVESFSKAHEGCFRGIRGLSSLTYSCSLSTEGSGCAGLIGSNTFSNPGPFMHKFIETNPDLIALNTWNLTRGSHQPMWSLADGCCLCDPLGLLHPNTRIMWDGT
jgi:hypothetical protein